MVNGEWSKQRPSRSPDCRSATPIHHSLLTIHQSGRFSRQALRLLDRFLDAADHVEGGFRQVVVVAGAKALEALDGIGEVDELARRPSVHLGDEERMR